MTNDTLAQQIRRAASASPPDIDHLASLFAQMPGVARASREDYGHRIDIEAKGTKCGDLNRPYSVPFLFSAFGLDLPSSFDAGDVEGMRAARDTAQAYDRDGLNPNVPSRITQGPYDAKVEPLGNDRVEVTVTARLKRGKTMVLGTTRIKATLTRAELVEKALDSLGYYYGTIDMDADDGSWTMSPKLAAIHDRLAR